MSKQVKANDASVSEHSQVTFEPAVHSGKAASGPTSVLECGVVILPPDGLADEMLRLQAGFPPDYAPGYPPHLTLKTQFRCRAGHEPIDRAIARVCAAAAPFEVTVDGVQCFCSAGASIFFLHVLPNKPLRSLHTALVRALSRLTTLSPSVVPGFEGRTYRPHLTLLRGVPDAEVAAVRERLAGVRPNVTFPVRAVHLICHFPDAPWQEPRPYPLLGEA